MDILCQTVTIQDETRQIVTIRDILQEYPLKGGTHDNNGRSPNCRGGGTETENASRSYQASASGWQDTRLQNRGILASEARRIGEVDRGSKKYSEELISVSSVARRTSPRLGTSQAKSAALSYLIVYYSNESPRITTYCYVCCDGQGVADWEGIHHD